MVVPANVASVGDVDEFPNSGSKMTIISSQLAKHMTPLPRSRPPLVVVGGSSVTPCETVHLRTSVGDISGFVEAAVLENNALPFLSRISSVHLGLNC